MVHQIDEPDIIKKRTKWKFKLKGRITEMKNSVERLNSRSDLAEESINLGQGRG